MPREHKDQHTREKRGAPPLARTKRRLIELLADAGGFVMMVTVVMRRGDLWQRPQDRLRDWCIGRVLTLGDRCQQLVSSTLGERDCRRCCKHERERESHASEPSFEAPASERASDTSTYDLAWQSQATAAARPHAESDRPLRDSAAVPRQCRARPLPNGHSVNGRA